MDEKIQMVEDYNSQKKMISIYQKMILRVLKEKDLEKIQQSSRFLDSKNTYKIPKFLIQSGTLVFNKLPKKEFI